MTKALRNRAVLVGMGIALVGLSACSSGGSGTDPSPGGGGNGSGDTFTVALARATLTPAEEVYMYAVPKQLGYFDKEGISVDIVKADGSTAALQALASNSADAAFASAPNIAAAIDKGVPVKAYAGATLVWPYYTGVPKDSEVKTFADLKGKTIGVISLASASYADLVVSLKSAGLAPTDVTIVPVGAGAPAAAAVQTKKVEAVNSYDDGFTTMAQNGVDLRLLDPPAEMEKMFSVTLATRSDELTNDAGKKKLVQYTRAAYKGVIYTFMHPEEAMKLACKEFPGAFKGCEDPSGQDFKNTVEVLKTALSSAVPKDQPDPTKWGKWLDLPTDRWEAVVNFAAEGGTTSNKLAVADIWDGSLMAQIYDFNAADAVDGK